MKTRKRSVNSILFCFRIRTCVIVAEERPRINLLQAFCRLFAPLGLANRAVSTPFGCAANPAICMQVCHFDYIIFGSACMASLSLFTEFSKNSDFLMIFPCLFKINQFSGRSSTRVIDSLRGCASAEKRQSDFGWKGRTTLNCSAGKRKGRNESWIEIRKSFTFEHSS